MPLRRGHPVALLAAWSLAAGAQQPPEPATLEKAEVVGSHIKRVDGETASPVTIIRREEIEASGASRLSELLLQLPYTQANFDDRLTGRTEYMGSAAVSMRGLGYGATLVLLNGRRMAPYGAPSQNDSSFVDLNGLPLAAVDRIEILRDGASAIYGAEALAGVINIVLRRDFTGVEAAARFGRSTHGDLDETSAALTVGIGDLQRDRYNLFAVVDLLQRDALPMTRRDFSRTADQRPRGGTDYRSLAGFPPTVLLLGQGALQPAAGCPPARVAPLPNGVDAYCSYDNNLNDALLAETQRAGLTVVGAADLGTTTAFTELSFNRTRARQQFSPVGVFEHLLPGTVPTNPYGEDLLLWWRPVDYALRNYENRTDSARAVVGLRGIAGRWDWEGAGGYSRIETDFRRENDLVASAVYAALDAGLLNPFTTTNDPALFASMSASTRDRYLSTLSYVQAKASTTLTQLQHGPLGVAIGGEARRESFTTRLDPLSQSGDFLGTFVFGITDSEGSRTAQALHGEVNVPLSRTFEAQLAGRLDHYSDFGSAFSPKLALRWQAQPRLLLRASAGSGFLPPTLFQLNKPSVEKIDVVRDPIRCPVTQAFQDCFAQIPHVEVGNPDLKAEHSNQFNLGFVAEPTARLSFSLDAWRIDLRDKIVFGDRYFIANENLFPDRVIRAPASPEDIALGLPGPMLEIHDTYINLAQQKVQGIDVELRLSATPFGPGQFSMNLAATWLDRFASRTNPDEPFQEQAGTQIPRWKLNADAQWAYGPWQLRLAAHYLSAYQSTGSGDVLRRIGSFTTFDTGVTWRARWGSVALLVRNLADRDPPFFDVFSGYDAQQHDPRGRLVSLTVRGTL